MIRQDYLVRTIEQLAKVLAKILFNKSNENYQEAINYIDNSFQNILGLDSNLLNMLPAKDILSLLAIEKDDTTVCIKSIAIAKLIKEKTDVLNLINTDSSNNINDYLKALYLYLEAFSNKKFQHDDFINHYADVKEIVKLVGDKIPLETRFKLFKFYELIGEYDQAIYQLNVLEKLHYPYIYDEGVLFFKYLKNLTEVELNKGNISSLEVANGLAELS